MQQYRAELEPIPGPEAFEEKTLSGRYSQAAFLLATSGAVGGYTDLVEDTESFPIPEAKRLHQKDGVPVQAAFQYLDVDEADIRRKPVTISAQDVAPIARDIMDDPDPVRTASLVEGCLRSPDRLVRTAAAASAIDTTGPREEVVEVLVAESGARDELIRDIARTALARIDPEHTRFKYLRGRHQPIERKAQKSNTAVITHGTFARRSKWWPPGGDFYQYVESNMPSLDLHHNSYQWTGDYSHDARDFAAQLLKDWLDAEGIVTPHFFGHSHGGTVAHLATRRGQHFDKLILMSWPYHKEWTPELDKVNKIYDIRVAMDLVIMADRGRQSFKVDRADAAKVTTFKNGWFNHGATHQPSYWDEHGLVAEVLA